MNSDVKLTDSVPFDMRVTADYAAMSRLAADMIIADLSEKSRLLLGAATGATPTLTYDLLGAAAAREPGLFAELRVVKIDEWAGLASDDPATCEVYLQERLIRPLNISPQHYLGWRPDAPDQAAECRRIERWLAEHGPIDLCVLGLGSNGHLAFNEPADALALGPHVAELSAESLRHPMLKVARRRPRIGLTIGIGDIMRSRRIILLVSGVHKAAQMGRLVSGSVTTQFPASLLRLHPQVTVICDDQAAGHRPIRPYV